MKLATNRTRLMRSTRSRLSIPKSYTGVRIGAIPKGAHPSRWPRPFAIRIPGMSSTPALPSLFTPIALRGVTARNRVVVSPMCQYSSESGGPTDYHLVHLGKFAMGGVGIVFCEETAVEARVRKSHHCAGIYQDAHIP